MTTIRQVVEDDVDAVLAYISRWVASSVYAKVLPDPSQHDGPLLFAALERGVALVAVDDAGAVVGVLVAPIHDYMGSVICEEVAWFADEPRDLLRMFAQLEREAMQKRANVLKVSAPASSDLGAFYARRGYEPLESVHVKVLGHGMGSGRTRGGRPRGRRAGSLREEEERAGQGRA